MSQPKKPAKKNHFIQRRNALQNLAKCKGIPSTARRVAAYILGCVNDKSGLAYPSQSTIATDLGFKTTRAVERAIKALFKVGAFEVVFERRSDAIAAGIDIKEGMWDRLNIVCPCWAWDGFTQKALDPAETNTIKAILWGHAGNTSSTASGSHKKAKGNVGPDGKGNVGPDSKGNVGPDTRTTSYQGNIPAGPEEQEFEALRASHSQDESERSYRQGKTDQTYIIPDDLPDPDGFLEFLAEFHKYNPLRSITPNLVASLIPHWMDSPEFRTSWVDVMKNIWDSEGIKKSFPQETGGLNPKHLFTIKASDMLGPAPVWQQILAKAMYWNYKKRSSV